ncbi:MAG: nitroreductase family protein [Candidatus Bathyarchaeota archaeon]|nr:nitroreductase family protein [Candidatus Bathyarchaeota archaeon]
MSNLHDAIRQRRNIRKYLPREVPRELVLDVLEAAGWAPSAHNSQPWRFIIIEKPKVKQELSKDLADAWAADLVKDDLKVDPKLRSERELRFAKAPALILACLTMEGLRKFPDAQRQGFERDLAVESLGAGLQNLLLAAHEAGLGACWFCAPAFAKETVRKVLAIPPEVEPSALIILGYPAEKPKTPPRKPLKDFCYVDVWGKGLV